MNFKLLTTALLLLVSSLFTTTFALTRYVGATLTPNYPTIQAAINASVNGDVIQVGTGTYSENINFSGKNIAIEPFGTATPTIQGLGNSSVVTMDNLTGARLEGFSIKGGIGTNNMGPWGSSGTFGGGVFMRNSTNCKLLRLKIEGCKADLGGGISVFQSSDVVIGKTYINNCKAAGGGGISVISSGVRKVTVSNVLITNCTATVFGGGIEWNYSTIGVIEYTTIANCSAGYAAAIKRGNAARFDAKNCIFWGNSPAISQLKWDGGTPTTPSTISHSIVESSTNASFASNNIDLTLTSCKDVNPAFVSGTDYHLQSSSPAINSGTTAIATDDLEGTARPINCVNDMGCYEMRSQPIAIIICAGATTNLVAPQGSTYQWSTGAITQSIAVIGKTNTTYTVKVTTAQGCSYAVSYIVTVTPAPQVSIAGKLKICLGGTTVLTASGGIKYVWSNGAQTPTITVGAGTYTVTATNANGCTSTMTVTVVASSDIVIGLAAQNVNCKGNISYVSINIQVTGGVAPYTYSWSNGSTTPNLINIQVTAASYCVTVTDAIGCKKVRCFDCINPCAANPAAKNNIISTPEPDVQAFSTKTPTLDVVQLGQNRPNPVESSTIISYSLPKEISDVQTTLILSDLMGREVKRFTLDNCCGEMTVDTKDLSNGNYIYSLIQNNRVLASKKMVIAK